VRTSLFVAVLLSLALHAGILVVRQMHALPPTPDLEAPPEPLLLSMQIPPIEKPKPIPQTSRAKPARIASTAPLQPVPVSAPNQTPASMAAPPPPTAEEWGLASTYTLKNSKRYRYHWGQQVRSMMGTAVEGPQQGHVRFRIEIAANGKLAKIDTLWSTSDTAEKLARQAMESLPPLPPTPTGQPLVFEQTIAFAPYESGWPPIYKYDCFEDPPTFKNPFVWNGTSPQVAPPIVQRSAPPPTKAPNHVGCHNDAQPDSMEAETADIKRQFDIWSVQPLNGVK
jgi:hypothetical protein